MESPKGFEDPLNVYHIRNIVGYYKCKDLQMTVRALQYCEWKYKPANTYRSRQAGQKLLAYNPFDPVPMDYGKGRVLKTSAPVKSE